MNLSEVIPVGMSEVFLVVKLFFLLGLLMYLLFAIVVSRQAVMMDEAITGLLGMPLRTLVWLHLILAIGVLLLAVVML